MLKHTGCAADRTCAIVAMLDYTASGTSHDKACDGRYVECIFSVAAGTDYVNGIRPVELNGQPPLKDGIAKANELVERNAAHQIHCHEGRELAVVAFTVGDIQKHFARLVATSDACSISLPNIFFIAV